jgi:hypothetical protein
MFSQASCKDLRKCVETTSTSAHTWRTCTKTKNKSWQRPSALKHASGAQCSKPIIYGMSWGIRDMHHAWFRLLFTHMSATDSTHVRANTREQRCASTCQRACVCRHSDTPSDREADAHTHAHTLIHTHTCTHTHACIHRTRTHLHAHTHERGRCMHTEMVTRMHTRTHTWTHSCLHTCNSNTHTHTNTHAHTHAHQHVAG